MPQPLARGDDFLERVFRVGDEVAYIGVLSALWIVASIPLVTIPAATVGVYATVTAHVADGRRGYVRPFWRAFTGSFRRVTLPGLACLLLLAVFVLDAFYYLTGGATSPVAVVLGTAQVLLAAFTIATLTHLSALWGRAQAARGGEHPRLIEALSLTWRRPTWSLAVLAVTVAVPGALLRLHLWQLAPFVVGLVCYLNARVLVRMHRWGS